MNNKFILCFMVSIIAYNHPIISMGLRARYTENIKNNPYFSPFSYKAQLTPTEAAYHQELTSLQQPSQPETSNTLKSNQTRFHTSENLKTETPIDIASIIKNKDVTEHKTQIDKIIDTSTQTFNLTATRPTSSAFIVSKTVQPAEIFKAAPVTKIIDNFLSAPWKNSENPTTSEVNNTFNNVYKTIENSLQIAFPNTIKKITLKQAMDKLPDGKDQKKINSWSVSIQKTLYRWSLNFKNSLNSLKAKSRYCSDYQDISTKNSTTQAAYVAFKYNTYINNLDMYKVLYPTTTDIANNLSSKIITELTKNQSISQQDIDAIQLKFVTTFNETLPEGRLKNAYKTLGLDPNTATPEQAHKKYRELARKGAHTDKGGNSDAFLKIKEADDIIQANSTQANKTETKEELINRSQEDYKSFKNAITTLVDDIHASQDKTISAQKTLRNKVLNNSNNQPIDILNEALIKYGKVIINNDGTTSYTNFNKSIDVDSQGTIINIDGVVQTPAAKENQVLRNTAIENLHNTRDTTASSITKGKIINTIESGKAIVNDDGTTTYRTKQGYVTVNNQGNIIDTNLK